MNLSVMLVSKYDMVCFGMLYLMLLEVLDRSCSKVRDGQH